MKGKKYNDRLVIYQGSAGSLELKADTEKETIWATQAQIADVFGVERSVVTKHIGNVLKSKEIDEKSNVQKMHIANSDKPITFYALDIILAVGYRTNSARAIAFRQWATRTLREHILKGYTINRKRIAKNYSSFIKAVENVRALLPASSKVETADIIELIKMFAGTWFSLAAYDQGSFGKGKVTRKRVSLAADELAGGTFTRALRKKRRICFTLWSRAILLPMGTSGAGLLLLSGFCGEPAV